MTFDPTQFGATPTVSDTPTPMFNPAQFGAIPSPTPSPQVNPASMALGAGKFVANAILSPVESLGTHLSDLLAGGTADLADKMGYSNEAQKIRTNLSKPQTNLTGGPVSNLSLSPTKAATQIAGDIAASALSAYVPDSMGVIKLGLMGGASGAANSLAAGNTSFSQISNDTKKGILYGGILGLLGNAASVVSGTEKAAAGVTPAMENELKQIRPSTLSTYINTAVKSSQDYHAPAVDSLVTDDITKGLNILDTKVIPQAGKALEKAKTNVGNVPISYQGENVTSPQVGTQGVDFLKDDINQKMQAMTGHQFNSYATGESSGLKISNYPQGPSTNGLSMGTEPGITPIPGRSIQLSASDKKALEAVNEQLDLLKASPNVQTASDVLKNLDSHINWDRPQYGEGTSPVDGVIRYARGAINRTIAPAAPELAQANQTWGALQDIRSGIGDAAGKDLQGINLLARRATYKDQQGKAQSVLDGLYGVVKPYLPPGEESYTTKAILGEYASKTFGGERGVSGLSKSVSTGDIGGLTGGYRGRMITAGLNVAKKVLAPDAAQYALSISKGEPYSFVPFMHHIDEFIDSPSGNSLLKGFKDGLKEMGVSSSNVGTASKAIMKSMIYNQLTRPSTSMTLSQ